VFQQKGEDMKKLWLRTVTLSLTLSLSIGMMPANVEAKSIPKRSAATKKVTEKAAEEEINYREGEAVIMYQNGLNRGIQFKASTVAEKGMEITKTYDFSAKKTKASNQAQGFQVALVKSDDLTTKQMIQKLKATPGVITAEANMLFKISSLPNEPYNDLKWELQNDGQNGGTVGLDINVDNLPAPSDTKEKVVAVVDSGVDYTHEELKDKMWNNPFTNTSKLAGTHGYDFVNSDNDPMDDNNHGTHVSGTIAAQANNGKGISGVAASSNIKIMALKIADDLGYIALSEAIGAYNYISQAQDLGVNVVAINNSWSGVASIDEEQILEQMINLVGAKGAVSVCAAGNYAADIDVERTIPASFESPYVISVAATDENDQLASFSSYGKKSVDLAAPGVNIFAPIAFNKFNPVLYEATDGYYSMYYDFLADNLVNNITAVPGKTTYYIPDQPENVTVSTSTTDFFGRSDTGASLSWKIEDAVEGENYWIYFPYEESTGSQTSIYTSYRSKVKAPIKYDENGYETYCYFLEMSENALTEENIYEQYSLDGEAWLGGASSNEWLRKLYPLYLHEDTDYETVNKAIAFSFTPYTDGDFELFFDDMGISQANVEQEQFGKYDFFNGTSMATAVATGAMAALADAYPEKSSAELQEILLGSVRISEDLTDKVKTRGILDLSKSSNPNPTIYDVTVNSNDQIQMTGNYLSGVQLYINDVVITPVKSDAKSIYFTLDQSYENKMVEYEVKKGDFSQSGEFYYSSGKAMSELTTIPTANIDGKMLSDGSKLYFVSSAGKVAVSTSKNGILNSFTSIGRSLKDDNLFSNTGSITSSSEIYFESEPVVANQKIYAIVKWDYAFGNERILAYFDLQQKTWKKQTDLPASLSNLSNITLGIYNDVPYLIGGYDIANERSSDQVMRWTGSAWQNASQLPAARFASLALQIGNKLVVTLGGNDTAGCPVNMIFDGTNWTSSKVEWSTEYAPSNLYYIKNNSYVDLTYYTADIARIDKGILYFKNQGVGSKDMYQYQLDQDTLTPISYSVSKYYSNGDFYANTVNNNLYVLHTASSSSPAKVLTMPVKSGFTVVNSAAATGGQVTGSGTYLPGDKITLQARVSANYYLKSFTLNGKAISANPYSFYAGDAAAYQVQAVTGAYATQVKLNKTALTLEYAKTAQLSAGILPSNTANKKLVWQSSNPSVATVTQTGLVKAVSKKAGQTAVITAKAADRGKIAATCKITIAASLLKKNAKVTVAGLTYKVLTSDQKNGKVSLIGVKNKKAKKVTIPAAIKVNGISYKVTTVEKTALKGLSKLTSVTIKSANLTKIAKGSMSSLRKKTVIKVPTKSKQTFKKRLKSAGFKGIVR
jgi:subtilisin family serine protease/uncharacterized protein YjdB